ncbi:hypothetical protein J7L13_00415 [bacterium]|nr:hypothetical protein [bacterium]
MLRTVYVKPEEKNPYFVKGLPLPFIPVFDCTDHFHWACPKCKEIAKVLLVERNDSYANTPTIYFYLECPKCGGRGFRKIYLEDMGKHYLLFPETLIPLAKTEKEARSGIIKG